MHDTEFVAPRHPARMVKARVALLRMAPYHKVEPRTPLTIIRCALCLGVIDVFLDFVALKVAGSFPASRGMLERSHINVGALGGFPLHLRPFPETNWWYVYIYAVALKLKGSPGVAGRRLGHCENARLVPRTLWGMWGQKGRIEEVRDALNEIAMNKTTQS